MTTIRQLPIPILTSRTSTAPMECRYPPSVQADAGRAAAAVVDSAGRAAIVVQVDGGGAAAVVADGVRGDRAGVLRAAAETGELECKREG
jgi:uncharacterized protein (UPF0210 family)